MKINSIVNRFVLVWVIINIVMLPAYASDRLSLQTSLVSKELKTNLIEDGLFSKITPLDNDVDDKNPTFSNIYLLYLIFLMLLGFLFKANKKSQITIFIILALVILIAVALSLYIYFGVTDETEIEQERVRIINTKIEPIRAYVQTCVDDVGYEGLKKLGYQGGYIDIPNHIKLQNTAFWYLNEKNIQPLLNETAKRLIEYVNNNLKNCLDFTQYTQEEGLSISYDEVSSNVIFGADDTTLEVFFPIKIRYKQVEHSYEEFTENYNIRYRRIWELASKYSNRFFDTDFDHTEPLTGVDPGDLTVSMERTGDEELLIYKIEDLQRFEHGHNDYTFRFAFKNGNSTLPRIVELTNNQCDIIPTYKPYVLYSRDRDAHLIIRPGTTFDIPGDVCELRITQRYENIVSGAVQVSSQVSDADSMEGSPDNYITPSWPTPYPIYDFGPDGTRSSLPMKLKLYPDEDYKPPIGELGILASEDGIFFKPIDSNPVYGDNPYVWTERSHFTEFTIADCGATSQREAKQKDVKEPSTTCWALLAVSLIGGGLIGGFIFGALFGEEGEGKCVSFTPTCDGIATLEDEEVDGKGRCGIKEEGTSGLRTLTDFLDLLRTAAGILGIGDYGMNGSSNIGISGNPENILPEGADPNEVLGAKRDDVDRIFRAFAAHNTESLVMIVLDNDNAIRLNELFTNYLDANAYFPDENTVVYKEEVKNIFASFINDKPNVLEEGVNASAVINKFNTFLDENPDYFKIYTGDPEELSNQFNNEDALDTLASNIATLGNLANSLGIGVGGNQKFLQGGQTYKVCAQVEKCDKGFGILCKKCHVECTVTYT